jgi:hypothetical protein
MSNVTSPSDFNVNIMLHAAGPIRPRTKYKEHKLLRAEGSITLPFGNVAARIVEFPIAVFKKKLSRQSIGDFAAK